MSDSNQKAAKERYRYVVRLELPDEYDPDELAAMLDELADRVREHADPPVGEIWSRNGLLIAVVEIEEDENGER